MMVFNGDVSCEDEGDRTATWETNEQPRAYINVKLPTLQVFILM